MVWPQPGASCRSGRGEARGEVPAERYGEIAARIALPGPARRPAGRARVAPPGGVLDGVRPGSRRGLATRRGLAARGGPAARLAWGSSGADGRPLGAAPRAVPAPVAVLAARAADVRDEQCDDRDEVDLAEQRLGDREHL